MITRSSFRSQVLVVTEMLQCQTCQHTPHLHFTCTHYQIHSSSSTLKCLDCTVYMIQS